jgi:hypothetical protein
MPGQEAALGAPAPGGLKLRLALAGHGSHGGDSESELGREPTVTA